MSALRPSSSAKRRWNWAWSHCAKTACAASSMVIPPLKKSLSTLKTGRLMPKFSYVAMDHKGKETKGTLEVANQGEAVGRLKEMGFFPTKVVEAEKTKDKTDVKGKPGAKAGKKKGAMEISIKIPGFSGRVKSKVLTAFTRQLATLVDAGLPLLRGLRVLEKQEKHPTLKSIIGELGFAIEGGSTFSEALAQHPKV